jgi:glycosyltransferase involved in cell wall biosynthesis
MEQIIGDGERAANAFQLELLRSQSPNLPPPQCSQYDVLFESGRRAKSAVAVVISLFNYGQFVEEALESVKAQTLAAKDVIVIDDCSTDDSASIARAWLQLNASVFTHAALIKNKVNSGVSLTRNAGFSFTDAPYVMVLDADNLLNPNCLERCFREINRTGAAVAYPLIRKFGESEGIMGNEDWSPARLANANYIDTLALVRRSAWARAGGYQTMFNGWEDYNLWCRFVELGLRGCWVREILANYRVHGKLLLHTSTDLSKVKQGLVDQMRFNHPWVDLPHFERASRV